MQVEMSMAEMELNTCLDGVDIQLRCCRVCRVLTSADCAGMGWSVATVAGAMQAQVSSVWV
jgi:hypothetical protein